LPPRTQDKKDTGRLRADHSWLQKAFLENELSSAKKEAYDRSIEALLSPQMQLDMYAVFWLSF
jgi:hypothetical protein